MGYDGAMGRRWMLGVLALALACGDDDASETEPAATAPAPEARPQPPTAEPPTPEPEAPPARMVVLIGEKALELRTMANPSEGEPWAAEREPVDGSFVLLGATADHVLLQEPVVDRLGIASRFHVVVRGGAAAEPVQAGRALVAPDGEHWLVERSYQRFRCGGMGRGRNLFVRTFGSDEERAIGEGFVGFGPEQTLVLSITTSDCGPAGGLRNHQSFVRMGSYGPPPPPTGEPGRIGAGAADDPNARLAFHPAPWIEAEAVPVEVEGEVFGPKCFLTLGGERTQLMGPACRQPESAGFSADGSHYAFVMHVGQQAELWVVERASGDVRKVPLGAAGDAGAMPGICGGPDGDRWLVTRADAVVVAVNGSEVSELGTGLCLGTAPGGETYAVQLGERIELRDASAPTAEGTVLEGVTGLRWLPPSE